MASDYPLIDEINFAARGLSKPKKTQGGAGISIVYASKSPASDSHLLFQPCEPDDILLDNTASPAARAEALAKLPRVRTAFYNVPDPKFPSVNGKWTSHHQYSPEMLDKFRAKDDADLNAIVRNSEDWLKRGQLPLELIRHQFKCCITKYPASDEVPEDEKEPVLRCKIDEYSTKVFVQDSEDFKKFRRESIHSVRRNARILPVYKDAGLYFRSSESGGQLYVHTVLVFFGGDDDDTGEVKFGGDNSNKIQFEDDWTPPIRPEKVGGGGGFSGPPQHHGGGGFGGPPQHQGGDGFGGPPQHNYGGGQQQYPQAGGFGGGGGGGGGRQQAYGGPPQQTSGAGYGGGGHGVPQYPPSFGGGGGGSSGWGEASPSVTEQTVVGGQKGGQKGGQRGGGGSGWGEAPSVTEQTVTGGGWGSENYRAVP